MLDYGTSCQRIPEELKQPGLQFKPGVRGRGMRGLRDPGTRVDVSFLTLRESIMDLPKSSHVMEPADGAVAPIAGAQLPARSGHGSSCSSSQRWAGWWSSRRGLAPRF